MMIMHLSCQFRNVEIKTMFISSFSVTLSILKEYSPKQSLLKELYKKTVVFKKGSECVVLTNDHSSESGLAISSFQDTACCLLF